MSTLNYKGNMHPFAVLLAHSHDIEKIKPVIEKLAQSGLRLFLMDEKSIDEKILNKACSVITFLSEKYYDSEDMQNAFIKAGNLKKNVISIRTDEAEMPEILSNYSYSKNSLNMGKYDTDTLVEKILSADELKNPKPTKAQQSAYKKTVIGIIVAAALLVAAIVIGVVSNSNNSKNNKEDTTDDFLVQTGILEEELEEIMSFVLIGDFVDYSKSASEPQEYVSDFWNDEKQRDEYVFIETGERVEMGGPEDLSFLTRLPNLSNLILINQNADTLPDLSGLENLRCVIVSWSDIENIEGLRNCPDLDYVSIQSDYISDLSPLSDCPHLNQIQIRDSAKIKNFNGLSSASLNCIQIYSSTLEDLSGLSDCKSLDVVDLNTRWGCPQFDLSPLGNCSNIRELNIDNMNSHMGVDLSFASNLSNLTHLEVFTEYIAGGLQSVKDCSKLQSIRIEVGDGPQYLDVAFLGELFNLNEISLQNINCSLSFLSQRALNRPILTRLSIYGNDIDFNGLESMSTLGTLEIGGNGNFSSAIFENLKNVTIGALHLNNFGIVDLSKLPESITELKIDNSDFDDLGQLSCKNLSNLYFGKNNTITSLSGIEELTHLKALHIWDCYKLNDYEALYEVKDFHDLHLTRQMTLPDYSRIQFQRNYLSIGISNIPGLEDLSCLDVLTDEQVTNGNCIVDVQGTELENLNALYRFKGDRLIVSDNLEIQAKDLIEQECFRNLEIEYPNGWEENDINVQVNSLDELENMPKALLKYIKYLCIAGDDVYDDSWWVGVDDMSSEKEVCAQKYNDNTKNMIFQSAKPLDMELISQMTGLEYLCLAKQTIDSLDGIQNLENLNTLRIVCCDVEDISPIFAIDSIRYLTLYGDNITSIDGIQNLFNLSSLSIEYANVDDISPLKEMKYSNAVYEEGFELGLPLPWMNDRYPTDVAAIAAPPKYSNLNLNNYSEQWEVEDWVPYLEGKEIVYAFLFNSFNSIEQLERFVDTVGSVRELYINYSDHLTDISCLTRLNGLEKVCISGDMTAAKRSLENSDYAFELEIQE